MNDPLFHITTGFLSVIAGILALGAFLTDNAPWMAFGGALCVTLALLASPALRRRVGGVWRGVGTFLLIVFLMAMGEILGGLEDGL